MEYRFLGRTGIEVSELCLGAMMFGLRADEPASHRMLDIFVEAGGNFVDTAGVYGHGLSEEIIGRWLKHQNRDELIIATKIFDPNLIGHSRKSIHTGVEASLRRLGTDYIDLYQVHVFDTLTPPEETLSTLDSLVTSGKVRFIGASNYPGWGLQKAVDLSWLHHWEPFVCLQPMYSLLARDAEWELIPICQNEGLGVIPFSPLAMGWLTGRYGRGTGSPPEGTRIAEHEDWTKVEVGGGIQHPGGLEAAWQVLDAVDEVAAETGRTQAQVALRWLLQRPGVTAPIIGASSVAHVEDNLGATGWRLTDEQMHKLTDASDRPLPYPYGTHEVYSRRPRSPQ